MKALGDDECEACNCSSFAHSYLFTHSAIMDLCPSIALGERTFDLCQYTYHELAYLHGLDAPRYPMPVTMKDADVACITDCVLSPCPFPAPCAACWDNWTVAMEVMRDRT